MSRQPRLGISDWRLLQLRRGWICVWGAPDLTRTLQNKGFGASGLKIGTRPKNVDPTTPDPTLVSSWLLLRHLRSNPPGEEATRRSGDAPDSETHALVCKDTKRVKLASTSTTPRTPTHTAKTLFMLCLGPFLKNTKSRSTRQTCLTDPEEWRLRKRGYWKSVQG